MITGSVNTRREAIITVAVLDPAGHTWEIDAVVDSGFNGFLTLPGQTIEALGLPRFGSVRAILVDGREDLLPTYKASIMWDGTTRIIDVDAADSDPLVGMGLLAGYELHIQVVPGGSVIINPMP